MVRVMALGTTELRVSVFLSAPVHRNPGYGDSPTMDCRTFIRTNSTVPFSGPFRKQTQLRVRTAVHPQLESTPRTILLWGLTNDTTQDSSPIPPMCELDITIALLAMEMSILTIPTSIRLTDTQGSERHTRLPARRLKSIPTPGLCPRLPRSPFPPSLPILIHSSPLPRSSPRLFSIPLPPLLLTPSPRCR